ncbi:hypothetical protein [Jeotgalibacillus haloalkalitolerans]|uniref:Uncharacterized protein n=1 Tax=Jeotgalibacillus haloalkalitolerans TaxID=3104292 RepID=A0ABU5KIW9_9BACL|nr:hypothetical protein [Jeotgalibacillus sp. HH7-29]MDZ5710876.1 hypothetical protein [Jeotgalibacillus sp. HH7-29]
MKNYLIWLVVFLVLMTAAAYLLVRFTFMEWQFTGIVILAAAFFFSSSGGLSSNMGEAHAVTESNGHYSPRFEKAVLFFTPSIAAAVVILIASFIIPFISNG